MILKRLINHLHNLFTC